MGRYGIALVACLVVLAGCAGPRALPADDRVADRPAARGWATADAMVRTNYDLGAPPAGEGAMATDDFPPAEDTTPAPSEGVTEAAGEEIVEVTPAEIEMAPVPDDAPTLRGGCGTCAKGNGGCQRCPCPDPCGNPCGGYVGGSLQFAPGLGAGLEWGINLKRTDRYLLSFEMGVHYQDFYDEFLDKGNVPGSVGDNNQAGKSNGIRIGLRWRFAPCCKWHPTLRAGIAWQSYTGGPEALELAEIDSKGDYLGAYVGAGLEWDINARWSTGPEVAVFYGVDPESGDTALAPTLYWHINYKF